MLFAPCVHPTNPQLMATVEGSKAVVPVYEEGNLLHSKALQSL